MKRIPLLLLAVCAVSGHADTIGRNPRSLVTSADGQTVVIEGTWELATSRRTVEIPQVNSFRLECSRRENVCREYVAKLITPADDPLHIVKSQQLFVMFQEFAVTYWDRRTITAKAEPRAADIFLEISLHLPGAVRTSKETEARGALGARNTSDKWVWR
jgi:hypothetical protein